MSRELLKEKSRYDEELRLAFEIADETSASVIDGHCAAIRSKSGALLWYEVDPTDQPHWWYVARALRYLTLRGKLRRQKGSPDRVKVVR